MMIDHSLTPTIEVHRAANRNLGSHKRLLRSRLKEIYGYPHEPSVPKPVTWKQ